MLYLPPPLLVQLPLPPPLNVCVSLSGITGTVKAVIGETADDSNQALGLSVIATSWGIGLILGPAVGAALSDPLNQYNITASSQCVFLTCIIIM